MPARKNARGQWTYRKWVTDWRGVKVRISGTPPINTRTAAEGAERQGIARAQLPPSAAERTVQTLKDFVEKRWWLKYPQSAGNAPTTVREKEIHIRLHLLPHLGDLPLDMIRGEAVDSWLAALRTPKPDGAGLGAKTIKNVRATLRKILVKAQEWGDIAALPALPKVTVAQAATDWFTAEESTLLLKATRTPEERVLLLFALHTGARAGEQTEFRWGDVDWVGGQVVFRRSQVRGEVGSTKSKRERKVPLTDDLRAALKGVRGLQHLHGDLVFQFEGRRVSQWQLHERLWGACRRAGLREIRWHDLRHTFASQLSAAGVPLRQIQEWMGHSTIQMTMRYASLAPGNGQAINVLCAPVGHPVGTGLAATPLKPT